MPRETGKILQGRTVWNARGCPRCLEGYSGRTGIFELLVVNDEIENIIRDGRIGADAIELAARGSGMTLLENDAVQKALEGQTSLAEISGVLSV